MKIKPKPIAMEEVLVNDVRRKVLLFEPQALKGGGFVCHFEVSGVTDPCKSYALGVDSLQALLRAMSQLVDELAGHDAFPFAKGDVSLNASLLPILLQTEFFGPEQIDDVFRKISTCYEKPNSKSHILRKN